MDIPVPQPEFGGPFTVERYFALVDEGVLAPDDRVDRMPPGWPGRTSP